MALGRVPIVGCRDKGIFATEAWQGFQDVESMPRSPWGGFQNVESVPRSCGEVSKTWKVCHVCVGRFTKHGKDATEAWGGFQDGEGDFQMKNIIKT